MYTPVSVYIRACISTGTCVAPWAIIGRMCFLRFFFYRKGDKVDLWILYCKLTSGLDLAVKKDRINEIKVLAFKFNRSKKPPRSNLLTAFNWSNLAIIISASAHIDTFRKCTLEIGSHGTCINWNGVQASPMVSFGHLHRIAMACTFLPVLDYSGTVPRIGWSIGELIQVYNNYKYGCICNRYQGPSLWIEYIISSSLLQSLMNRPWCVRFLSAPYILWKPCKILSTSTFIILYIYLRHVWE